ncbi:hypothetical protein GCM10009665_38440 [Kitasatospora nipponensis]|uniref:Secreted protein n=1 Tax=Kitasatospora nipponensis TaxID=258049 RepID=A0ABP4GYM9_9ACTN
MKRTLLLAAGAAGLALTGAAPAFAATATTTTETCSYSGLQSGLSTKVCADVSSDGSVQLFGQIALAGPPSPGGPGPQPQYLNVTLSGNVVGGDSLGTVQQNVIFRATTTKITGVGGTVACGSTVHASFSVSSYPWFNTPVTVDVPVNC